MFVECAGVPDRLWAVALTICGDFSDPYLTTYYDPDAGSSLYAIL